MTAPRLLAPLLILSLTVLTGCTTASKTGSGSILGGNANPSGDPLLDAPNRAVMTCSSVDRITVLNRFNDMMFSCPDLGVTVKVDELRDAGWRVLGIEIGEEQDTDSHVGFPVNVKVRKLF